MTIHAGTDYRAAGTSIGAPPANLIDCVPAHSDVAEQVRHWLSRAASGADVYYFAIFHCGSPVGQILLHDIDLASGSALIAYHVFDASQRGKGIGTQALGLLQTFVREATELAQCTIITSRDNPASQQLALKCGFAFAGPSREDPINGMVFHWQSPRRSAVAS